MSKFKNQKVNFYYTLSYISQRIDQILEILGLYCFAFATLATDKTFTQRNFFPSKIEIASMYFSTNIQKQMRPKIRDILRTANFSPKFTGSLKKCN